MKTFATHQEGQYKDDMEQHLKALSERVQLSYLVNNFAKYVRRQELTRFLVRHELFKRILHVKGSVLECGVFSGNGVFSWAQLSAILEPVNFFRRIYGFDTFEGFPSVHKKDLEGASVPQWQKGDLRDDAYEDLCQCIQLFDANRFLPQFPKVELIKGDFMETGKSWLKENPHLLIALLYLDFDLYEPTMEALRLFLPRMPKGSILAFDEINNPMWPGETLALLESLELKNVEIQQMPYEPNMAWIVL